MDILINILDSEKVTLKLLKLSQVILLFQLMPLDFKFLHRPWAADLKIFFKNFNAKEFLEAYSLLALHQTKLSWHVDHFYKVFLGTYCFKAEEYCLFVFW